MSQPRLPPPPPRCLGRGCPSSQKGGTLIVESVIDFEEHDRRVCPDGYRPAACAHCGHVGLHAHDYRERSLRAQAGRPSIRLIRYLCPNCRAVWLVVPLFLARCLWRSWTVVEGAVLGAASTGAQPRVPGRTVRRWAGRLASAARLPVQVLAQSGNAALAAVAVEVGLDATREQLVRAYQKAFVVPAGACLAAVAALLHRLAPGVRLM